MLLRTKEILGDRKHRVRVCEREERERAKRGREKRVSGERESERIRKYECEVNFKRLKI